MTQNGEMATGPAPLDATRAAVELGTRAPSMEAASGEAARRAMEDVEVERVIAEGKAGGGIRAKAVSGAMWTVGGFGASTVIRFGGNIVLSYMLTPAVFGVMQMVQVVMSGLQMFTDVGIGPSIIQNKRGEDKSFLNTAWTVQVIRGLLIFLVACGLAYPVSRFYEVGELLWVLPVMAFGGVLLSLQSTAIFLVGKRMDLAKATMWELVSHLAGLVPSIVLAYFWKNVWAIVVGALISNTFRIWVSRQLIPDHRDRFELHRPSLHNLMRFGGWVFLSTIFTFLQLQSDRLILGKLIPIDVFGLYGLALMLTRIPVDITAQLGRQVAFPAFSAAINEGQDLRGPFQRLRVPVATMGVFVVTGIAACGPHLIYGAYKPAYFHAALFTPLLAVGALFMILEVVCGAAILAKGHARLLAVVNAVKLAAVVALVPGGFHLFERWAWIKQFGWGGIEGAIVGVAVSDIVRYLASAYFARREGLSVLRGDAYLTALGVAAWAAAFFGVDALLGAGPEVTTPKTSEYFTHHGLAFVLKGLVVVGFFAWPLWAAKKRIFGKK